MLVLATFFFVCIGSIFFLPDRMGAGRGRGAQPGGTEGENALLGVRPADGEGAERAGGKVYKVYKVMDWSAAMEKLSKHVHILVRNSATPVGSLSSLLPRWSSWTTQTCGTASLIALTRTEWMTAPGSWRKLKWTPLWRT